MKKKLLLIALPALMALSGCANIQKEQPKVEFEEDTIAHEEIFGEAIEAKQPAIRKMSELDYVTNYKLGYQIHFDNKGDGDASNDTISIRFIAAIQGDIEDYTSIVWHRGLARGDGEETLEFSDRSSAEGYPQLKSNVVYSSLSNGGSDIMRAGEGDYEDYDGFVVYSLRNIPYEEHKDSYMAAYLTLTPKVGSAVTTDLGVLKVETNGDHSNSLYSFAVESDGYIENEDYFLYGRINGQADDVYYSLGNNGGSDNAYYTLDLKSGDYFGSFYYNGSAFKYFSYRSQSEDSWSHFDESYGFFNEYSTNHGFATPKLAGNYSLFVSDDEGHFNHVYTNANAISSNITLWLKPGKWSSARFAIYLFKKVNDVTVAETWVDMVADEKTGIYKYTSYNSVDYPSFIFCRMNNNEGHSANNWDNKWNQSRDLHITNLTGTECCFVVVDSDPWDKNGSDYFDWYSNIPD